MRQPHAHLRARLALLLLVLGLVLSACDLGQPQTPTPTDGAPALPTGATLPGGSPPDQPGGVGAQPGDQPGAEATTTPAGGQAQPGPGDQSGQITSGGSLGQVTSGDIAAVTITAVPATAVGATAVAGTAVPPTAVAVVSPPPLPPGVTTSAMPENLRGWIAYIGLDNDIWIMTSDAKTLRRIVDNPGTALSPDAVTQRLQWSPSGRRLLYTVDPRALGQTPTLFVWDADSGHVYNLGQVASNPLTGAWLPDSNQVAIARPSGNVVVRDIERGTDVNLGQGTAPAWMPPAGSCAAPGTLNNAIAVVRGNNIWLIDYPPRQGGERQLTKYGTPGPGGTAVGGTMYLWDCRVLFFGDPTGGLGANGNGMAVWGVNLVTGAGGDMPVMDRGGRIQQLSVSPEGRHLALTEDQHINACIAAGGARVATVAGQKVADLNLPLAQQGYHTHTYGLSWAPRGENALLVSYSQHTCASADPATLQSPIGARIYLYRLNALDQPQYIGDGSWPAWNAGSLGLGQAPGTELAGR